MRITNKYNLPEAIVRAAQAYEPKPGRIGVTTLIDAPLPHHLKRKHWDDIEEDVLDRLWALRSQGAHKILELNAPPFTWPELKLEQDMGSVTLVCVVDLYTPDEGLVEDYKDKSVWGFVLGDKKDIERQLNCNAQMIRWSGWCVSKLRGNYFLRDWSKSKAGEDNYPSRPFHSVDIPLWTEPEAEQYIANRLALHGSDNPPECTPDERWEKPTTYAVMKKGRKSALRVLSSEANAIKWRTENGGDDIVCRPGKRTRCEDYCSVSQFCPYYQEYLKCNTETNA